MPDGPAAISTPTWGEPDVDAAARLEAHLGASLETRVHRGELTIVVPVERWRDAALFMRDHEQYDFCSDVVVTDWLGYGGTVAGYWGTDRLGGRDINEVGSSGASVVPRRLSQARFSISSHLLKLLTVEAGEHRRVRLQTFVDDGVDVPSLVPVYPTADYHEREAFDMMGISFSGHPNLCRILLPDYWVGHPQRKDYPIGGEPVQFSDDV